MPWVRDFAAAHCHALAGGKPISVYSTMTHRPHRVVMERGHLSGEALARSYAGEAWKYLLQDSSGSEQDRAARRVAIRFGTAPR